MHIIVAVNTKKTMYSWHNKCHIFSIFNKLARTEIITNFNGRTHYIRRNYIIEVS